MVWLKLKLYIYVSGPPDPVSGLLFTDISYDSVELSWIAGFDYGSSQKFQVQGSVNNKPVHSK